MKQAPQTAISLYECFAVMVALAFQIAALVALLHPAGL
jgi:hypothetical protein